MKAIICTKYGPPDVLQLKEVKKPAPKDDEVLLKVHAVSINSRDWRLMRANPFFIRLMAGGLLKPKNSILGVDIVGTRTKMHQAYPAKLRHCVPA